MERAEVPSRERRERPEWKGDIVLGKGCLYEVIRIYRENGSISGLV
jgi:hypothetical protein